MKSWRIMSAALACLFVLVACNLVRLPVATPAEVSGRTELPSCPEERREQGDPPNAEGRQCLLTAFEEGRPAEFVSTRPTIEGDPITTIYRVWPSAELPVEIFQDATRDRYGSGAWSYVGCEALEPTDSGEIFEPVGCPDEWTTLR